MTLIAVTGILSGTSEVKIAVEPDEIYQTMRGREATAQRPGVLLRPYLLAPAGGGRAPGEADIPFTAGEFGLAEVGKNRHVGQNDNEDR